VEGHDRKKIRCSPLLLWTGASHFQVRPGATVNNQLMNLTNIDENNTSMSRVNHTLVVECHPFGCFNRPQFRSVLTLSPVDVSRWVALRHGTSQRERTTDGRMVQRCFSDCRKRVQNYTRKHEKNVPVFTGG